MDRLGTAARLIPLRIQLLKCHQQHAASFRIDPATALAELQKVAASLSKDDVCADRPTE
jgi:hypothetical protein